MFLLETIKIENRQLQNIHWHNQRLNQTRRRLFGEVEQWDLKELIQIPNDLTDGVFKCRVTYGLTIEKIEFEKYTPKLIQTLKIVHNESIDYSFKYANRNVLRELYAQKVNCDDILIIKNGWITDTSYCNIAFFNGQDWLTPETPLLEGTHRAYLLSQNIIVAKKISVSDLASFQYFKVFNALMNWYEQKSQIIEQIFD